MGICRLKQIKKITDEWSTLYDQLIDWNLEAGSSLQEEIIQAWEDAQKAVERYGDALSAIEAMHNGEFNTGLDIVGKDDYQGTGSVYREASNIIKQMKRNSEAWHTASKTGKETLERKNKKLGYEKLQSLLPDHTIHYDDHSGKWFIDGEPLFTYDLSKLDYYHKGGKVGVPPGLKENEVLAVLEDGETVLSQKKASAMTQMIDTFISIADKFSNAIRGVDPMSIFQKQRALFETGTHFAESGESGSFTFAPEVSVVVQSNGSMDDREAKRIGDTIADATLEKLKGAFAKKGFNNLSSGLLKP